MQTPIDRALDAQYTKRWTMVGADMDNNVATHSFNVALIAMDIRKRMSYDRAVTEMELCYFAVIHDIKEVYTGDIPTPTKMKMRASGFDPDTFDPDIPEEKQPSPDAASILKAADLIDNYVFIFGHGTGTRARTVAAEASRRLGEYLDAAHPDLRQAAAATLDYVMERKSEHIEERERFAQNRQRLDCTRRFTENIRIVD